MAALQDAEAVLNQALQARRAWFAAFAKYNGLSDKPLQQIVTLQQAVKAATDALAEEKAALQELRSIASKSASS